jgi:hypothetical protein
MYIGWSLHLYANVSCSYPYAFRLILLGVEYHPKASGRDAAERPDQVP